MASTFVCHTSSGNDGPWCDFIAYVFSLSLSLSLSVYVVEGTARHCSWKIRVYLFLFLIYLSSVARNVRKGFLRFQKTAPNIFGLFHRPVSVAIAVAVVVVIDDDDRRIAANSATHTQVPKFFPCRRRSSVTVLRSTILRRLDQGTRVLLRDSLRATISERARCPRVDKSCRSPVFAARCKQGTKIGMISNSDARTVLCLLPRRRGYDGNAALTVAFVDDGRVNRD